MDGIGFPFSVFDAELFLGVSHLAASCPMLPYPSRGIVLLTPKCFLLFCWQMSGGLFLVCSNFCISLSMQEMLAVKKHEML